MASTITSTIRLGIRKRAAVSMPLTPLDTTNTPMASAMAWVSIADGEAAKEFQKASGTSVGISRVMEAHRKRSVHPITTL